MSLLRYFGMITAIVFLGLVAYANSFQGVFLLDDNTSILQHQRVHDYQLKYLLNAPSARPVTELTFALNYAIGQENTFHYHLVNLVIHLCAAVILFDLVQITLRNSQLAVDARQALWFALAVSLLWVAHPLQTQSVTYIVQRGESLASLFYLGCLNCTARGAVGKNNWRWYLAAIVFCLLGMASKQIAFTAPIVVLLFDRMFLAASWKETCSKRWWLYLGFLPLMAWVLHEPVSEVVYTTPATVAHAEAKPKPASNVTAGFQYQNISSWQYLCTQAGVILYYLRLSIWPHPLVLDYAWPVAKDFTDYALPGLLVCALLILSIVGYVRGTPWGFLGLAFFLILAPTSSIMPIQHLCVEHRMYLPLACVVTGFVWSAAWLIEQLFQNEKTKQICFGLLIGFSLVGFTTRTILRNQDYASGVKIWGSNVYHQPQSAIGQSNYAHHLMENNQFEKALTHAQQAVALNKNLANAYINLAAAEIKFSVQQQQPEMRAQLLQSGIQHLLTAEGLFNKQTGKQSGLALTYANLAAAYFQMNDLENSLKYGKLAIRENPNDASSYHLLADLFAMSNRYEESDNAFQNAAKLNYSNFDMYFGWGQLCHIIGTNNNDPKKIQEAVQHFTSALHLNSNHVVARYRRALALKQLGRCDLARKDCVVLVSSLNRNSQIYRAAKQLMSQCQ